MLRTSLQVKAELKRRKIKAKSTTSTREIRLMTRLIFQTAASETCGLIMFFRASAWTFELHMFSGQRRGKPVRIWSIVRIIDLCGLISQFDPEHGVPDVATVARRWKPSIDPPSGDGSCRHVYYGQLNCTYFHS